MKRLLAATLLLLLLLLAVMTLRALRLVSQQPEAAPAEPSPVDPSQLAAHLGEAIRFQTLSPQEGGDAHAQAFRGFDAFLVRSYPRVHGQLSRERVAAHSLLYRWEGRSAEAPPLLLAAHQDVVPVEPGTEDLWQQPPFEGRVVDGVVWGRGAIDDKGSLICILEAVESLLAEGFVPTRPVLLAFGHDEEVGGHHGAAEIAATLAGRGTTLSAVIDEGGVVADGMLQWMEGAAALVGVAEKGSLSLELSLHHEGGHSSTPPRHGAIGILARALARLEESPMPARIDGTTRRFLETLAPELSFPARMAMANLWLTERPLLAVFSRVPPLDAMTRTSTAVTLFHGGIKENVLPRSASAVVNFRILPGDSIEDVVMHVRRTIDDERIEVRPTGAAKPRNPSPVSPDDSPEFAALARAIRATHPDAIVTPYLVLGGTDARHYASLTPNVYRFGGFRLGREALTLLHGSDERISVENLDDAVRFYRALIQGWP